MIQKFVYSPKKKWISHNTNLKKWPRTQDLNPLYIANSAVFLTNRNIYTNFNNRICKNPLPILSPKNKGFDVDDINDFKEIEKIIKSGQKIF